MLKVVIFVFVVIFVVGLLPKIIASLILRIRKKSGRPVTKIDYKGGRLITRQTNKTKKKISAWAAFAGKQRKQGKTFKEAARLWKLQNNKKIK